MKTKKTLQVKKTRITKLNNLVVIKGGENDTWDAPLQPVPDDKK